MSIGIEEIASYIPQGRISNFERKEELGIDDFFIEEKIGMKSLAIKCEDQRTSDLCIEAFNALRKKTEIDLETIECLIVISQNPDKNLPHTSAVVHGALDIPESCACFDISLGCSGYVYGLSVVKSFMESNKMKKGLLFTADPYSSIIDMKDKNTSLLFGDAASVSLISDNPRFELGSFTFGTIGKKNKELECNDDVLYMNGRGIFNFAAKYVPKDIPTLMEKNEITISEIDQFIFHQGSKYIVDTLIKRMGLPVEKVPFDATDYGNTVSSSIPIILEKKIKSPEYNTILISGFGVGLSWSSCIIKRKNDEN